MSKAFAAWFSWVMPVAATLLATSVTAPVVRAQNLYNPQPISHSKEIVDTLTQKDIPIGDGGFARDYVVTLDAGDQVAIDLISDNFDTMISVIASDGSMVAENDDGPDGSTNSLLFARITETDEYIIRVRAFGSTGGGKFRLKITRLKPI
ncbi:MAG: peptidase [Moorea sp. SIO1F2]|uniref:PPC domain-containing protein n=1 Tax=unclassified Moorena TaxID=2683338 RepID=UPI0013BCF6C8|nr:MULTISPECIES: PPC domain-containing protein [unclassified Moorena]NEO00563.1 peptidase [Moorena sp. SIO3I7]NEO60195.1 peptidase [Moorena sp. SIO4G2]NEO08041.1 peptidase [Moorena sp. SIO3I8]NEO16451.1 peptidase [Moorena sp. SIO3E8]NEO22697.1 peptidase [Moorena sp. SIO4A5]